MPIAFDNSSNYIPVASGNRYLGQGGEDTYLLSSSLIEPGTTSTIEDSGTNNIELSGLSIASSTVFSNAVQLTLSNEAQVRVLGADNLNFDVGGNSAADVSGTEKGFQDFVEQDLGTSIPDEPGRSNAGGPAGVPGPDGSPPNRVPSLDDQSFQVAEDAQDGTAVGSALGTLAQDPDGDPMTFSIEAGNTDVDGDGEAAFALDDDQLVVNDADDLVEDGAEDPFALEVAVRDGNAQSATAEIAVDVTSGGQAYQAVDLSNGDATGSDGTAEAFVYDFEVLDGRATNVGDGEVNLEGFNPDEDILRFDDMSDTWSANSDFLASDNGVAINEDPFAGQEGQTLIAFDTDDQGNPGLLRLMGIQDRDLSEVPFEVV